ncbi:MAG: type III secretion system chaperone [Kiritimatiellae bacterium]|nr:type III secretion system chaperone [Kiritimatiellia bacterium]
MQTEYERLIGEVSAASGVELKIAADRVCEVAVGDEIVLVKPTGDTEEAVTMFAVVVGENAGAAEKEKALSMNLFGRATDGGVIGLFADALIYSKTVQAGGLSAEDFASLLVRFAGKTGEISAALAAQERDPPVPAAGASLPGDFMRV